MRPIKIVGSDTDLHDYQVRIHLDRSNFTLEKCKPDGSDIRFRDDSGEILPYWIERWNAAEGVIWCKIPFIPAESSKFIWMIYGNPNAKSESNGNAVFEMFDVQGIVGFWHMDEPQWTGAIGEVKDETGVNHGTAGGGATTTSDAKYGRAGLFDGSNDYVDCGSDDSLNVGLAGSNGLSLEAWVKPGSTAISDAVIVKNGPFRYGLTYHNATNLFFYIHGGDNSVATALSYDVWHHVVGTWDGTTNENGMKLYFDGVLVKQKTSIYDSTEATGPVYIGGTNTFDGPIDEVRIWERALTPTEVKILSQNYMQKMGSYFNVRKYVTPAPVVIV